MNGSNITVHTTCSELTEFTCVSTGYCISEEMQCNGVKDCEDGSDEVRKIATLQICLFYQIYIYVVIEYTVSETHNK